MRVRVIRERAERAIAHACMLVLERIRGHGLARLPEAAEPFGGTQRALHRCRKVSCSLLEGVSQGHVKADFVTPVAGVWWCTGTGHFVLPSPRDGVGTRVQTSMYPSTAVLTRPPLTPLPPSESACSVLRTQRKSRVDGLSLLSAAADGCSTLALMTCALFRSRKPHQHTVKVHGLVLSYKSSCLSLLRGTHFSPFITSFKESNQVAR
ncbi:hypothetical protein QBC37DRAFT_465879 [Rhypophila decipiens]|uniref:Uncharacterized protein n=1 Tax=Rhypophila decipiens TaxID=261697 RepID=A0AAN6Y4B8_9PEZI|nr:hypothetical protein QBC37DRAFT_465879 [Rhypophila decipiens]